MYVFSIDIPLTLVIIIELILSCTIFIETWLLARRHK